MNDQPLGIQKSVAAELSEKEKDLLRRLDRFDLSFLAGDPLYRQGVNNRLIHEQSVEELKKFLAIRILREIHPMGCFGPVVAAAWHGFILDTQRYEKFCSEFYGKTIHHIPSNYGKGVMDNTLWMSVYREWFGPFPSVWKLDINGLEIAGYEHAMNVDGNVANANMDSDDGAFGKLD